MKTLKNKGFTLVELIAIVVILAAIFLVAVPTIINSAKSAENKKYNLMVDVLCDAGKSYIYSNEDEYDITEAGTKTLIHLSDLIDYGVVDPTTTNPKDNTLVTDDALVFTTNEDSSLSCTYHKIETVPLPTSANCNSNLVYNGSEQNLVKNPNENLVYTNDKGINAGSYTVTVTIPDYSPNKWSDDSTDSKTFVCSIEKVNDAISISQANSNYTGNPVYANITTTSGLTPNTTYYSDSTCTTEASPVNIGSYYVIATTTGNTNYNAANSGCKKAVVIGGVILAANVTCDSSKIFDGTRNANCTVNLYNQDTLVPSTATCLYDNANVGLNKTITCGDITLTNGDIANYYIDDSSLVKTGDIYNATLTFNANGGTLYGTSPLYIRKGTTGVYTGITNSTVGEIPTASKTGYTFNGWYTGNTKVINPNKSIVASVSGWTDANSKWLLTSNQTLTANLTRDTYTITYNLNNGSATNPTSYNVETNAFTLNNPTRTGYTFTGWSGTGLTGSSNTSVTIPKGSTGNRSYTANWSIINYSIAYDLKGGSATNPTSYNVETNAFTLNNPTKSGFTFTGWTGSNGSTKQTTITIPKGSTGNRSYTANWDKYNVTYNLNRGAVTFASNQSVDTGYIIDYSKDFTLRARVNIPTNSTGRHMIFGNYNDMSVKQDFALEFNADNQLRVWMNYDGNSAVGHAATVFTNTSIARGVDIDVVFTWNAATKSYTFTTSGTNSNNSVTGTNTNMTGKSSYTLLIGTKDQRTGTSPYSSITVKSASITTKYPAGSTLSDLPTPSNNTGENYIFHGWFPYSNGTGTKATTSTAVNNDLTYYGYWTNEVLWMSDPTISKSLVTGTGTTKTTGYEAGTTFTFTCHGASGHYPTSLQIKYNGTATSTATNSSSTTYVLSNTYTVTDYTSSASVTATCTDNTGKTVDASGITRPVYRKFRLYHNLNGATSLSGGGGDYLNTNQYLLANSTAEGGGSPVTLYNINRTRIGSAVATLGWNSSSVATSKIWSKGESVNIYYGSGTQTTGKVYANSNYNAERTIYAISYDTIPSPAMENSNMGYFPAPGVSCGTNCGTQPSQTQTLSDYVIRVYNTRRYALSSTKSTTGIICAKQHAIYYHHAETGEKHRLDYTFVADGFDAGRLGTYIAGYVKGIMIPLNNYSSTGWSCELMQ